jgi:hypothetical protein
MQSPIPTPIKHPPNNAINKRSEVTASI